jgi:hypothetical protein
LKSEIALASSLRSKSQVWCSVAPAGVLGTDWRLGLGDLPVAWSALELESRRDAQDELHSASQARAWAVGDFDADHGLGLDGVGRSAH